MFGLSLTFTEGERDFELSELGVLVVFVVVGVFDSLELVLALLFVLVLTLLLFTFVLMLALLLVVLVLVVELATTEPLTITNFDSDVWELLLTLIVEVELKEKLVLIKFELPAADLFVVIGVMGAMGVIGMIGVIGLTYSTFIFTTVGSYFLVTIGSYFLVAVVVAYSLDFVSFDRLLMIEGKFEKRDYN